MQPFHWPVPAAHTDDVVRRWPVHPMDAADLRRHPGMDPEVFMLSMLFFLARHVGARGMVMA